MFCFVNSGEAFLMSLSIFSMSLHEFVTRQTNVLCMQNCDEFVIGSLPRWLLFPVAETTKCNSGWGNCGSSFSVVGSRCGFVCGNLDNATPFFLTNFFQLGAMPLYQLRIFSRLCTIYFESFVKDCAIEHWRPNLRKKTLDLVKLWKLCLGEHFMSPDCGNCRKTSEVVTFTPHCHKRSAAAECLQDNGYQRFDCSWWDSQAVQHLTCPWKTKKLRCNSTCWWNFNFNEVISWSLQVQRQQDMSCGISDHELYVALMVQVNPIAFKSFTSIFVPSRVSTLSCDLFFSPSDIPDVSFMYQQVLYTIFHFTLAHVS